MGTDAQTRSMSEGRALLTESERAALAGETSDSYRYKTRSFFRDRLDHLTEDMHVLKQHDAELLEELQDVVCANRPPSTETMAVVGGVLDVLDDTRAGHEVLAEDVLDVITETYPPEYTEKDVEPVLHAMAEAGLLHERDGVMGTIWEKPGVEPSECEWCGAPFPESGRHDVTDYDPDGNAIETVHICSSCLSERY